MGAPFSRQGSLIRQLQGALLTALGGKGVRGGVTTAVFSGSNVSATRTVTHGLLAVPAAVSLTPVSGLANAVPYIVNGSVNDTTFQFFAETWDGGTPTGSMGVHWIAYG